MSKRLISIIIPCFNEGKNIEPFFKLLSAIINKDKKYDYEIVYVNDGSSDDTLEHLQKLAAKEKIIRVVSLSRNFGKEIAMTAGIEYAQGDALLSLDGDGQHPAELIPEFIAKWEAGAQIVTGVRTSNQKEGFVKRYGSKAFHHLFNQMTGTELIPGSSDFRLIDHVVKEEFLRLTERNRITRGIIDWLGFRQDYIYFSANARMAGKASYNVKKLIKLAFDSFISLSLKPLYFSIYTGLVIMPLSILIAVFSAIEMAAGDPLHLQVRASAYLVLLILFLVGLLLIAQGISALYLSHIHTETQNRPLFIIDKASSRRISDGPNVG